MLTIRGWMCVMTYLTELLGRLPICGWMISIVEYIHANIRLYWILSKLPGPPSVPLLGHASSLLASYHRAMDKIVLWQKNYPVCQKVYLLFFPMVFIYSPEGIQVVYRLLLRVRWSELASANRRQDTLMAGDSDTEILGSRKKHNDKGSIYHAVIPLLEDGLITSKGDKWFFRRRLLTPAFHFQVLESFLDVFKRRTLGYIDELKRSGICTEYKDICPFTSALTLSFICETAMGLDVGIGKIEQTEILNSIHRLEEIAVYRCIYPWLLQDWIYRWTKMYREERLYEAKLHRFTEQLIERRRKALLDSNIDTNNYDDGCTKKKYILIDLLIQQSENGKSLANNEIREEINTFIFAGHNTTQLAINYCIFLLGCYPKIQEKAVEEVDSIFGDSDRDPTIDDLNKMKYIDCCIKEALRLYPSVPIIARKLTEDQKIGDYNLPKGIDCVILPYVVHRNPKYFPDPEKFNPDHFLDDNVKKHHPYSYIPFSAGPRNCIGKRFANLAEKIVISWVLRNFHIMSLKKQEDLKLIPKTVLVPVGGLKVKLLQRK